jgi:hypothetical protein
MVTSQLAGGNGQKTHASFPPMIISRIGILTPLFCSKVKQSNNTSRSGFITLKVEEHDNL